MSKPVAMVVPADRLAAKPVVPAKPAGSAKPAVASVASVKPSKPVAAEPVVLIPHNEEAERAVLACCLVESDSSLPVCIERFKVGSEVFYDIRHRSIYEAMFEMFNERQPIDLITLQQKLKSNNKLQDSGGTEYLVAVSDAFVSASNVSYYADIVSDKYMLRRLDQMCSVLGSKVKGYEGDVGILIDVIEKEVAAVRSGLGCQEQPTMKQNVQQAIGMMDEYHQHQGRLPGLPTGLHDFDLMTGGLIAGQSWVLAARPSVGKTSFAMGAAVNVAVVHGKPVAFLSGETTRGSLTMRAMCSEARLSLKAVRDGKLTEGDFPRMLAAGTRLKDAPIYIIECFGWSVSRLRAEVRRLHCQYGVELFVFDYLQKFTAAGSNGRRLDNRQQEVAEISAGLTNAAKELNASFLILAQLNRAVNKRAGGKPDMGDLRESGAIEQDADGIALLYQEKVDDDEDEPKQDDGIAKVNLDIAKQKDGPTGTIELTFLKCYTRFESIAKVSSFDVPSRSSAF